MYIIISLLLIFARAIFISVAMKVDSRKIDKNMRFLFHVLREDPTFLAKRKVLRYSEVLTTAI